MVLMASRSPARIGKHDGELLDFLVEECPPLRSLDRFEAKKNPLWKVMNNWSL